MRTALIDGDSIAYILGYNFRDSHDEDLMQYSVDNFIRSTLGLLEVTHYIGALSSKPVFRDQIYQYARYKGKRGEDHLDIARWKPFINGHLENEWKFIRVPNLEADDIVGYHAYNPELGTTIICSPDKDLKQVPGELYDYRTGEKFMISEEEALDNFKMLMICGDTTDNIKGVPGLGEVKARKKLAEGISVYQMYVDYFGTHYGAIIYEETLATVQVMCPEHSYISFFKQPLDRITPVPADYTNSFLKELDDIG
jgi:5'-3' exonuclease